MARLTGWRQDVDGSWWTQRMLAQWSHAHIQGKPVAEPCDVLFAAPAALVEQVPGEDYRQVPAVRRPAAARHWGGPP